MVSLASAALSLLGVLLLLLLALVAFAVFVTAINVLFGAQYHASGSKPVWPSRDAPMELHTRNLHFSLEATDADHVAAWNANSRFFALFLAALSLFFPAGERMFCRAVQHHARDPRIQADQKLSEACKVFVSQEAVHGREHEYYNTRLAEQYPIAEKLQSLVEVICQGVTNYLPYRSALGATVALEHWTALMGSFLLAHPMRVFGSEASAESRFGLVWQWHACEETEHKAVAFDVYERIYGTGLRAYLGRCESLILASLLFWSLVPVFFLALLVSDGCIFDLHGWVDTFCMLVFDPFTFTPGMAVSITPAFCDYFRAGFHPWDMDNHEHIQRLDLLQQQLKKMQEQDERNRKEGQAMQQQLQHGKAE